MPDARDDAPTLDMLELEQLEQILTSPTTSPTNLPNRTESEFYQTIDVLDRSFSPAVPTSIGNFFSPVDHIPPVVHIPPELPRPPPPPPPPPPPSEAPAATGLARGGIRATSEQRSTPIVAGECVVCPAVVSTGATRLPMLDDFFAVQGTSQMFDDLRCCSNSCRAVCYPARLAKGKGKAVAAMLEAWMTRRLKTQQRIGATVRVLHDYSPGRRVDAGDGTICGIEYMPQHECAQITVRYAAGGTVRVWPRGITGGTGPAAGDESTPTTGAVEAPVRTRSRSTSPGAQR